MRAVNAICVLSQVASVFLAVSAAAQEAQLVSTQGTKDGKADYVAVGTAKTRKSVLAVAPVKAARSQEQAIARIIQDTLNNDLAFMDIFAVLDSAAFVEKSTAGIGPGKFQFSDWTSVGAELLVKVEIGFDQASGNLELHGYLYDVKPGKMLVEKVIPFKMTDAKRTGHFFANQVVEAITGLPGIFLTKIAMSCERGKVKEIYVMNFDGTDTKQITHHNSVAFAPAWSPDGTKIAYSLFTKNKANVKNIDLYEFNSVTNSIKMLSNRKGINSGAAYSPKGDRIALTMSFMGNPEIYSLDVKTKVATRLTKSLGFDVDPSWSPDSKSLAFVSSRTGVPMVFSSSATELEQVKRLTYAGRYNATPSWSPTNNKIAFAGWLDAHFDIFTMNPDGTHIERLSKEQGNNEDPHFSPDGNFIAFSSSRSGGKNVYVMNIDGSFVKRLTFGLGDCVSPKWSAATGTHEKKVVRASDEPVESGKATVPSQKSEKSETHSEPSPSTVPVVPHL